MYEHTFVYVFISSSNFNTCNTSDWIRKQKMFDKIKTKLKGVVGQSFINVENGITLDKILNMQQYTLQMQQTLRLARDGVCVSETQLCVCFFPGVWVWVSWPDSWSWLMMVINSCSDPWPLWEAGAEWQDVSTHTLHLSSCPSRNLPLNTFSGTALPSPIFLCVFLKHENRSFSLLIGFTEETDLGALSSQWIPSSDSRRRCWTAERHSTVELGEEERRLTSHT